jgi:tRNA-dihydrouridine synthase
MNARSSSAFNWLAATQTPWFVLVNRSTRAIYFQARAAALIAENAQVDFIDINMGCPIDLVCAKGGGCAMMQNVWRVRQVVGAMHAAMRPSRLPLTLKLRMGYSDARPTAKQLLSEMNGAPVALYTLHGRSRLVGCWAASFTLVQRTTLHTLGQLGLCERMRRTDVADNSRVWLR